METLKVRKSLFADETRELDNLLYGATELHTVKVNSNRLFKARFEPNDLLITNIDIYSSFVAGEELCLTALTEGGASGKKQWEIYIYDGDIEYYIDDDSMLDFFLLHSVICWNIYSCCLCNR